VHDTAVSGGSAAAKPEVEPALIDMDGADIKERRLRTDQQKWARNEARAERERILKLLERDRVERKQKPIENRSAGAPKSPLSQEPFSVGPPTSNSRTQHKDCAIQVRLLDGGTIRAWFSPHESIRTVVRPWIDSRRTDASGCPYTLRQILAPLPNHAITVGEEDESLQGLRLTPSATLVMVPISTYIDAYSSHGGYIQQAVSSGYSILSTGASLLTGVVGSVLGRNNMVLPHGEATQRVGVTTDDVAPSSNIHILGDQDRLGRDDHELYNGNQVGEHDHTKMLLTAFYQLNFQPPDESVVGDCDDYSNDNSNDNGNDNRAYSGP
jgi:hypothetical protein